ncbi:hypothetical protein SIID45300_00483 [Candidatus Magnetaquicoccaceae bacterium FCR-1]|uniref:Metal-binding protein n=1 Tax=Candidatus Magnetaquiglobus chichijimensis TaxID=3141448 RepID=A0ABQ0C5L6_9PROT
MSVASALCHLCGLPLPADPPTVRTDDGRLFSFCCDSCRQIHQMLNPGTTPIGRKGGQAPDPDP